MEKRKSKKTRIILSAMALIEIIVLVVCVTFSWVEGGNRSKVEGGELSVYSGSNLMLLYENTPTNSITVPACTLAETSSADGRNFYFPLANNTKSDTASMKFREGVPADKNTKYISLDFDLQATSATANVYLGAGTIIQCSNAAVMDALRMSFTFNNNEAPIVFKPSQMPGVTGMSFSPITAISGDGTPKTGTTDTEAFGDYYYSGEDSNTLFTVEAGQTKHITLNIWLEGTTRDFPDAMENSGLKIYIDFTTSVDDLIKYNFVDNTHGVGPDCSSENWITNIDEYENQHYETMMYVYDKSGDAAGSTTGNNGRYYAMKKSNGYGVSNHTWVIYLPDTVTDFTFRRYCVDIDKWWNQWVPSMSSKPKDANNEYSYVAICGKSGVNEGTDLTPCGGYWKDKDGTYRIYFQNNVKWENVNCYAWNAAGNAVSSTGAHPGKAMTYSHDNTYNGDTNKVYYVDLKETDNITGIQFNNQKTDYVYANNYTHAYFWSDSAPDLGGNWPGKTMTDYGGGIYGTEIPAGATHVKFSKNGNSASGDLDISGNKGKIYNGDEKKWYDHYDKYEIKDANLTPYLFNGICFYYGSADNKGMYLYQGSTNSLIFP